MASGTITFVRGTIPLLLLSIHVSVGEILLEYGEGRNDSSLSPCDDCCAEVDLASEVVYFNSTYSSIFVCSNGNLNFGQAQTGYEGSPFPQEGEDKVMVAVWWVDIDIRDSYGGNLFYRNVNHQEDVEILQTIFRELSGNEEFVVTYAFVATWDNVTHFSPPEPKPRNSFQIAIVSATAGAAQRLGIYLSYGDLGWIDESGSYAAAGFNDGKGNYYNLPGSFSADLALLPNTSNVGRPGVWAWVLDPEKGVERCPSPPVINPTFSPVDEQATVSIVGFCNATLDTAVTVNVDGASRSELGIAARVLGSSLSFEMPVWDTEEQVSISVFVDGRLNAPEVLFDFGSAPRPATDPVVPATTTRPTTTASAATARPTTTAPRTTTAEPKSDRVPIVTISFIALGAFWFTSPVFILVILKIGGKLR